MVFICVGFSYTIYVLYMDTYQVYITIRVGAVALYQICFKWDTPFQVVYNITCITSQQYTHTQTCTYIMFMSGNRSHVTSVSTYTYYV